ESEGHKGNRMGLIKGGMKRRNEKEAKREHNKGKGLFCNDECS
ncbi:13935_t:CDS:1, partial [Racocetra fulgida]